MGDALEDYPPRAQIGYVLNNATVKQGELTPAMVVGILAGKGIDVGDTEDMEQLAEAVMIHRGFIDDVDN